MEKCHCSGVKFESVLQNNLKKDRCLDDIARDFDISQICTACKDDFIDFCHARFKVAS